MTPSILRSKLEKQNLLEFTIITRLGLSEFQWLRKICTAQILRQLALGHYAFLMITDHSSQPHSLAIGDKNSTVIRRFNAQVLDAPDIKMDKCWYRLLVCTFDRGLYLI